MGGRLSGGKKGEFPRPIQVIGGFGYGAAAGNWVKPFPSPPRAEIIEMIQIMRSAATETDI